ncbi:hypothetical protein AWRI1631_123600 [Saccharomyces cerevisiae AWRI1631]|uniref:Uncharacterized protein n=1 Tax=Saccharomyces cerevisiae (strain AWRI1631) TaxID=545124 RepID=B5VNM4_YEAS6|nr:hypothetical protein AWRI1631_123600 [Saccharomyces cerevisiae AWRI1631]
MSWRGNVGSKLVGFLYGFTGIFRRLTGILHRFTGIFHRFIGILHRFIGILHRFIGIFYRLIYFWSFNFSFWTSKFHCCIICRFVIFPCTFCDYVVFSYFFSLYKSIISLFVRMCIGILTFLSRCSFIWRTFSHSFIRFFYHGFCRRVRFCFPLYWEYQQVRFSNFLRRG